MTFTSHALAVRPGEPYPATFQFKRRRRESNSGTFLRVSRVQTGVLVHAGPSPKVSGDRIALLDLMLPDFVRPTDLQSAAGGTTRISIAYSLRNCIAMIDNWMNNETLARSLWYYNFIVGRVRVELTYADL